MALPPTSEGLAGSPSLLGGHRNQFWLTPAGVLDPHRDGDQQETEESPSTDWSSTPGSRRILPSVDDRVAQGNEIHHANSDKGDPGSSEMSGSSRSSTLAKESSSASARSRKAMQKPGFAVVSSKSTPSGQSNFEHALTACGQMGLART